MQRRSFIKVTTAGSLLGTFPGLLSGCGSSSLEALEAWQGVDPEETDMRLKALSYGILAPSPHNAQPWLIDLGDPNTLDLYVDPDRLLPEADPPMRQIHIGHGAFLENLDLALRQWGYRADIRYFPQGIYSNAVLEDKPVASVTLVSDERIAQDPLFAQITHRQSNRRVYRGKPLSSEQIAGLQAAYHAQDYPLTVITDSEQRQRLTEIMVEGMRIETASRQRDVETISFFRFNDQEIEHYRDGFGLAQCGVTGISKFFAELFMSRESALKDPSRFSGTAIEMTARQAISAVAFGWISSSGNSRLDQIKVGRAYERLHLTATALDIAVHPMSQVLSEYPEMAGLQDTFYQAFAIPRHHTVQMLFRLGHAKPTVPSPRRHLTHLLKA